MSSNDTTSSEAQRTNSDPPGVLETNSSGTMDHQADQEGDTLEVPPPTRPPMSDRQYSTHIYALNGNRAQPLGDRLTVPGQAHIPGRADSLPAKALVTIRPSRNLQRTHTDFSTSSGLTVNEITPPPSMLETAQARGPGTYRFSMSNQGAAPGALDGAVLEKVATVDYTIQSLDDYDDKIADQEYLEELVRSHSLPKASGPEWWNYLRHEVFSTYRRLFTLVLLGNLIALLYCIWTSSQDLGRISSNDAATAVGGNLFIGTLMRHEHCVNFLFRFFVGLPHWLPVSVRRLAAKIYSYGGIHSACGINGLAWYIYFTALYLLQMSSPINAKDKAGVCLAGVMLFMLTSLIVLSHPALRARFHDQWELCHRYFGWTCIGIIWVQIILIAISNAEHYDWPISYTLVISPAFWFLIGITLMIIYPWLHLRRVHYSAEQLSSHALRLWVNDKRIIPSTVGIKLSTSPWTENHSFATIPNADQQPGFSVLVSNNGDWTKRLITNPPPYLWARGAYTIGVMRVALLFKPLVVVATGSGIGPCLSFLQVHPNWSCRVVWSARFPEATYGKGVMESVSRADRDAVVIDTKKTGKPDLVGIVHAIYEEMKAEAVVIISNPSATKKVVYELETRKVPAFGAIFDS